MIEHYFRGKIYALCDSYHESVKLIKTLDHEDLEAIRHLMSFRPYVESLTDCKEVISILTDDEFLRKKLPKLLRECHVYIVIQRIFLEFFKVIIEDLPKQPLGHQIRELYPMLASANVAEIDEFKEIWQMLSFMCKRNRGSHHKYYNLQKSWVSIEILADKTAERGRATLNSWTCVNQVKNLENEIALNEIYQASSKTKN